MKEVILVGILTSLLVTIALYVLTIQHLEHKTLAMIHQYPPHQLRGVVVLQVTEKNQSYFSCLDGSSSKAIANDEYCDCSDGSDESQTSACSHHLFHQLVFSCKADGLKVYSSRVNDGVCDCPDGSDEYGSNLDCQKHIEITKLFSAF
jgi:protein kinase C substrate 80K-H